MIQSRSKDTRRKKKTVKKAETIPHSLRREKSSTRRIKKWEKATTRWCQRNFSEKGIRDRESSINQDTFFKFIARNNEKLAWKEIQLQNHPRNYSFLSQNNLEWMLTNDISIKTCLEKTKSMEKRHRRKNANNQIKKTFKHYLRKEHTR